MEQMINKSNNLLKNILTPSNVFSLAIRFPYNQSTFTQNITVSREYQLFKLKNLSVIGSSSWYNVSNNIGNNKFSFGQVEQNFFNDLIFTRAYYIRDKVPSAQTPTNFLDFSKYNYTTWFSDENQVYQQGEVNGAGVLVPSTNNTLFTTFPFPKAVYGPIIVSVVNPIYEVKISVFNIESNGTTTFVITEAAYSNATRTINTILPTYIAANNTRFGSFVINIRRVDGGIININDLLASNICTVDSGNNLNRSVITQNKTAPGTYNATTGQALTFSYNNTFDYTINLFFYHPTNNNFLLSSVLSANATNNNITFTVNSPLEGSYFYLLFSTVSGRAFNDGDLTNMTYIMKDLALGTSLIADVVIPDGLYSGIYSSLANTNPVTYGWKYITDLITAANTNLKFTLNVNNTVNIQNISADNILLGFSNFPSTRSSGRIVGYYDQGTINVPANSTIISPNPIDLDSDGQFAYIAINFPYLNSVGYSTESNSIIYLQKGSFFLQNISSLLPSYEKIINTNRIDALEFRIVDGKGQNITLFDSLLFTAEIQVYNNPDF